MWPFQKLMHRIQVKTATAQERNYGYNARFKVPLSQLSELIEPELTYVFVVRYQKRWDSFLLISRQDLSDEYEKHDIGSLAFKSLVINLRYSPEGVKCSNRDFSTYLDNWSTWPVIEH